MGKKRIIAHFMHEAEEAAASQKMAQFERTEGYLIGEIDEKDIPELERQRVIVQVLEEEPEVETPGRKFNVYPGVKRPMMRKALPTTRAPAEVRARVRIAPTKPRFYLIRLNGPLLKTWRDKLKNLQIELLEHVPRNNYTARLTKKQVREAKKLPFVKSVKIYGSKDKAPTKSVAYAAPLPAAPPLWAPELKMITYDVRLHREEDSPEVLDWLRKRNVNVAGASGRKIRIYLLENSTLAGEIVALPEVASMEEYVQPKLHNDIARIAMGIDRKVDLRVDTIIPQTGAGQIVAVADTGIDEAHPDFQGRIVGKVALGRPNDYSDPHGHGTHVSGSVLGNGTASGGKIKGVAPEASLFFQSIMDSNGGLGGLPLDLGKLFEEAYQAGARIHNNSWGAATRSMYTFNSIEVDDFVWRNRDMLIVISAGNEGQAATCLHSQQGFPDWLSIGSPASAKNALTVGASRSSRNSGGYSNLTYGQAWPWDFPNPPIAKEKISGNPDGLAAFSSRGPCDDRRIKPDVVSPGTDIASTKSSPAPLRNFWGAYPGNDKYAFMGGTSMAAPLVAGCAALVREYYIDTHNHEPSAALLKATIINSTRWLSGPDAIADHPNLPNHHQGFGCVYMPWAIPNPSEPNLKLDFLDTWKDPAEQFTVAGQRLRYQFSSSDKNRLRICLTWTDPPGRALQNNLNLFVQHLNTGEKWIGNKDLPIGLKIPDPDNPVEAVRLEKPKAGDYLIQITATNILKAPQDFALVATGDLTSPLAPY